MKKLTLVTFCLTGSISAALAGEYGTAMQNYLDTTLSSWVSDPIILAPVTTQNETSSGYDQSQIDAMDLDWRAQAGTSDAPC